ncbi:Sodium/calcium exchanger protein-domain-containing protein [Suillus placidus]|uniref:Sodium/calcium exchanger protein-domain-containing protein n=1 Tax=Suillus placidus TaxID=48579 RepID=A0A9P7D2D1_9AGAM|nr:Sodium/calcium exchanger protein-domain-containing protein [Suillus placidus]
MSSEPSPGSTTLDILRAYSYPTSPSSPDATSTNRPTTINLSLQPPDSRFSSSSYSPTSVPFAADKGLPSETNESPFRWNLPSPVEPEESGPPPGDGVAPSGGKGQVSEPTTHIWQGWRVVVFGSWFNLLLLLIPVSWTLSFVLEKHHKVIFIFSILSMIPLVKLHDLSTRELALRIGGSKAGLLNASMSNTVEMVIAITALRKCELRIVQSSLIGSILSKLLLVLGMCFFAGGLRFSEQGFDQTATQIHSSLLSISVGALLLPAAYHFAISGGKDSGSFEQKNNILKMSYGVSIILMFIYIAYLIFQFWSHKHLYQDTKLKSSRLSVKIPVNSRYLTEMLSASMTLNDKPGSIHDGQSSAPSSRRVSVISSNFSLLPKFPYRNSPLNSSSEVTLTGSKEHLVETTKQGVTQENRLAEGVSRQNTQPEHDHVDGSTVAPLNPPWSTSPMTSIVDTGPIRYASPEPMTTSQRANLHRSPSGTESFREPQLSWMVTLLLLTLVTITVAITAEDLVESMDGISTTISKQWVGLVLLPAVSSIAECVTAVNTSVKDQLNLSVSIAVGSSIQTTLLVIPFMVTLGWIIGRPLALLFDPFESVVLYVSVQTMSFVVADGKSNWLEGVILICLYVIIAVSFWFYPVASSLPSELAVCV